MSFENKNLWRCGICDYPIRVFSIFYILSLPMSSSMLKLSNIFFTLIFNLEREYYQCWSIFSCPLKAHPNCTLTN